MKKRWSHITGLLAGVFFLLITGCGGNATRIVLHSGFAKDEVFKIEQISCSLPEMMVYLTTTRNRYEKVYGQPIWEVNLKGVTLEENIKEMVLSQISQVKAMNLLAEREKVELTREEEKQVEEAAKEFYGTLNEKEGKLLKVNLPLIEQMYREYAVANKLYAYIVKDINPEVSDDEARTITVEHILIKTYSLNEKGEKTEYSEAEKNKAYLRAKEALKKAEEGADFNDLVREYNEDSQSQYSFRKGEMDLDFETTAFNLGKDEISDIIETQYGYHIIKCITTFNREETDANKIRIVEKKREEVFEEQYASFATELTKALNEPLWEKVGLLHGEDVQTGDFFEIYRKYLGESFENQWI